MVTLWERRTNAYLSTDGRPSVGPEAFVARCLGSIDKHDGQLHAFVSVNADGADEAASQSAERWHSGRPLSPIDGMPIGIKDIIDVAGWPTRMNSELRDDEPPVRYDAACVAGLRRAGAIIIGKTATTEFACGRSTDTVNPFDHSRTPGGSSSGAGAAVGYGLIPASLATQTRASTIRPAAYCGAYGYKPTYGSIHLGGVHPVAGSFDHLGLIAASLDELWCVARAIAAEVGGGPGQRPLTGPQRAPCAQRPTTIAMVETQGLAESDDATVALFRGVSEILNDAGFHVVDRRSDRRIQDLETSIEDCDQLARELIGFEMRYPYWNYRQRGDNVLGEPILRYLQLSDHFQASDVFVRTARRTALSNLYGTLSGDVDLAVTLAAGPAPKGLSETGTRLFITPWTTMGVPTVTLPLFELDGMPVGLQVSGYWHGDARLFAQAKYLEAALRAG